MAALRLDSHPDNNYQGVDTMENNKPVIEWITTVQAAKILKVNSTQAVRNLMERHPDELPGMNIGTKAQPRWMLRESDVKAFQKKRELPDSDS